MYEPVPTTRSIKILFYEEAVWGMSTNKINKDYFQVK